jgi:hypothetical protein
VSVEIFHGDSFVTGLAGGDLETDKNNGAGNYK